MRIGLAFVLAVTVGACASPPSEPPTKSISLPGTSWRALLVYGKPPVPGTELRITFHESSVVGTTGCNRFRSDLAFGGGGFSLGRTTTTLLPCRGVIGEVAGRFMDVLADVRVAGLVDGQLRLAGPAGEVVLEPGPPLR